MSFGALLQMTAQPGKRDELLRVLVNYANTLDGEPGTVLYAVAADPNDEQLVWAWEQFRDAEAVQAHFQHDFFQALQLELADLLPEELADDGIRLDPTKITIDIGASGFSSDELRAELFERFNIQVEKSTHNTLTLLLTVGTTRAKVSRLFDALLRLAKERRPPRANLRMPELPHFTRLACLPRDAFYEYGERLPLLDDQGQPNAALDGRVCCDQITPYPPGIPVLVPGQVVTPEIVGFLTRLMRMQKSIEMHGLAQCEGEACLRVLRPRELEALAQRSKL